MLGSGVNKIYELPETIVLYDQPHVMGGAMSAGFDIGEVQTVDNFVMTLVIYTTPDPIHGLHLWAVQHRHPMPKTGREYYFFGYKCSRCAKVFLVPSTMVRTESEVCKTMWHECRESEHGR